MFNEIPTPQYGQPISLEHPFPSASDAQESPSDAAETAAIKLVADTAAINAATEKMKYNGEGEKTFIGDSDLQRQSEVTRLEKMAEARKSHLDSLEGSLAANKQKIDKLNPLQKLGEKFWLKVAGFETSEQYQAVLEKKKQKVLTEIDAQKKVISDLQLFIEDPVNADILTKAVERASDESQIVQRMALGYAIREASGNSQGDNRFLEPDKIEKFADLYNKGEFRIDARHYKAASDAYRLLVTRLQRAMSDPLYTNPSPDEFYDPMRQVQHAGK
jgi:hypothetical protein